jgi:hypothetical protein
MVASPAGTPTIVCGARREFDVNQKIWARRTIILREQRSSGPNVRFGSEAEIQAPASHVRFTPERGHQLSALQCPLSAKRRHRDCTSYQSDSVYFSAGSHDPRPGLPGGPHLPGIGQIQAPFLQASLWSGLPTFESLSVPVCGSTSGLPSLTLGDCSGDLLGVEESAEVNPFAVPPAQGDAAANCVTATRTAIAN